MKKIFYVLALAAALGFSFNAAAKDRKMEERVQKTQELEFKKFGDKYVIRINPGQPLVASLKNFCTGKKIHFATISGIGSLQSVTLGFFNPKTKEYQQKTFKEPLEMASLTGNITTKDGEVIIHPHTVVAGDNYKALAGHMVEAEVSLTAEIIIEPIKGTLVKSFDTQTGLNLFDFHQK